MSERWPGYTPEAQAYEERTRQDDARWGFHQQVIQDAFEGLDDELRALIRWNAPDHDYTRFQVHRWLDQALDAAFDDAAGRTIDTDES